MVYAEIMMVLTCFYELTWKIVYDILNKKYKQVLKSSCYGIIL